MNGLVFSLNEFLIACGAVVTIIGAFKAIQSINPYGKAREKLNKHEQLLQQMQVRIDQTENLEKVICKSLLAILNHDITGNGIEGMKKVRDELQQALINY